MQAREEALRLARRTRRRLNAERALSICAPWLWGVATVLAGARLLWPASLPWAALPCGVAGTLGWALGLGRVRVSLDGAAIVADRMAGAGGMLLLALEVPLGGWHDALSARLRGAPLPRVAWARRLGALAAPLVLAILALGLDGSLWRGEAAAPSLALQTVSQLEAQLEALRQDGAPAEDLVERVRQLGVRAAEASLQAADWQELEDLQLAVGDRLAERLRDLGAAERQAQGLAHAAARGASAEELANRRETMEHALQGLASTPQAGTGAAGAKETARQLAERARRLSAAAGSCPAASWAHARLLSHTARSAAASDVVSIAASSLSAAS